MNKIALSILTIVVIGAVAALITMPRDSASEVKNTVTDFGSVLQQVPLLADTVSDDLQRVYGGFVAPALLAEWQKDPSRAPGRLTSSPWPDRIEVASAMSKGDGTYAVEGSVVEKSSTGDGKSYPVSIGLTKKDNTWLITNWSGYPPTGTSVRDAGPITVEGTMVCLPHKDTSGPQTLECAFGLKDDAGTYFALHDSDPSYMNIGSIPAGARVKVVGTFEPRSDSKYQDVGIITVTSVTRL